MAHFAELDSFCKVIRVIVVDDNDCLDKSGNHSEDIGIKYLNDAFGGTWRQTSYNTLNNVHRLGGTPFRKNYAGKGMIFDEDRDAFYPPKPYPSWILNEDICQWEPPIAYPDDGQDYNWNEETTSWDLST
mgnify:CR=1 FL=1|jgi:hypothetical protein|tara:strand:+ start:237 stop:626 length:390 start_codon:yes stop_codon:yes gene_type:complete